MPRLDRLPQISRNNLLTFPAQVNDTAPFRHPTKPLAACRLAIVTTAGVHVRGDRLFTPGDQTYRVIPSGTPTADILQSHTSIGFDRVAIMRDINMSHYSFMGAQREVVRIESQTGPEVARRLVADGVDAALITPT